VTKRSVLTTFSVFLVLVSFTSSAGAQTVDEHVAAPGIWKVAVASVSADANTRVRPVGNSQARLTQQTRLHSGPRKVAGAVVGVIGGFFAGGLIGASLDRNCRCDDPGLQGFVIGAPIGAIAGGVLGFLVASR
jgi:uncharacterized membrane protein